MVKESLVNHDNPQLNMINHSKPWLNKGTQTQNGITLIVGECGLPI